MKGQHITWRTMVPIVGKITVHYHETPVPYQSILIQFVMAGKDQLIWMISEANMQLVVKKISQKQKQL